MSEQDKQDEKRRKKSMRQTLDAISAVLRNEDGLSRLRDLSDEDWAAAQAADEADGGA